MPKLTQFPQQDWNLISEPARLYHNELVDAKKELWIEKEELKVALKSAQSQLAAQQQKVEAAEAQTKAFAGREKAQKAALAERDERIWALEEQVRRDRAQRLAGAVGTFGWRKDLIARGPA